MSLSNNDRSVIENNLIQLYLSATTHFLTCKKDLTLNYSSLDSKPEGEDILIQSDLTPLEEEIIAGLMLVEYIKPIMLRNEVLEQVLGDVDFNLYSQANHLNQLQSLYGVLRKEVNANMNKYSYVRNGIYD